MSTAEHRIQAMDAHYACVTCDWKCLSTQLLNQWQNITRQELEYTQHDRHAIAELIERKYGIDALLVENYLLNIERTLPLFN